MRAPRLLSMACLLIVAFILVGCEATPAAGEPTSIPETASEPVERKVMIFYKRGDYLVPVALKADTSQPDPKTAVDILLSEALPAEFDNPLSDVVLNDFALDGDTVTIDVSASFLTGEAATKRDQLVYTLMWCDNVAKVDLSVDGHPLENILNRPWGINIRKSETLDGQDADDLDTSSYLTVYYTDDETKRYLVPVTFKSDKIVLKEDQKGEKIAPLPEEKAEAALLHLVEGPGELEGLVAIFPQDLKAKKFEVVDGVAYVDVDGKLLLKLASEEQHAQIALQSIVQTLTAIDGIDKVQLTIDGKAGYIVGNINLSKPIPRLKWYNNL